MVGGADVTVPISPDAATVHRDIRCKLFLPPFHYLSPSHSLSIVGQLHSFSSRGPRKGPPTQPILSEVSANWAIDAEGNATEGCPVRSGWGMYSVGPSIIDTIRREVIRTLTAWSGLHAATTNFLRHLARSFTAKAPLVLFTGFSMRLVDPSTPTLVLAVTRRWKAFLPCNRSASFFFREGKSSRTIRVDCDEWTGF